MLYSFYICSPKEDISFNKLATQSHNPVGGTGYDASNAVDRNTTTCMRTMIIGIGRDVPDRTVWWKVDLGRVYNIYSIIIMFKNYDNYGVYFYMLLSYTIQLYKINLITYCPNKNTSQYFNLRLPILS